MDQIFEHIRTVTNIPIEIERKRQEQAERKKLRHKLFQLLAELVDTERRYVQDLEQACHDYLPLAGSGKGSLDRRSLQLSNKTRSQRPYSLMSSSCSSSSLASESVVDISETE